MKRKWQTIPHALLDDVRRTLAFRELEAAKKDEFYAKYGRSLGEGDVLAVAMSAGRKTFIQGCRFPCRTDYLAASGAVFPEVPYEKLVEFNKKTLRYLRDERDEERRYAKIADFFRDFGRVAETSPCDAKNTKRKEAPDLVSPERSLSDSFGGFHTLAGGSALGAS